jgi:hypothetical protein
MEKPSEQISRRFKESGEVMDEVELFALVESLLDQLWEEVERLKRERAEKA